MKNCPTPLPAGNYLDDTWSEQCSQKEYSPEYCQRAWKRPGTICSCLSVPSAEYNSCSTNSAKSNVWDATASIHKSACAKIGTSSYDIAINYACMIAKGIMTVHEGYSCEITIANLGKVDSNLLKHQNIGKVVNARVRKADNKDDRFCILRGRCKQ